MWRAFKGSEDCAEQLKTRGLRGGRPSIYVVWRLQIDVALFTRVLPVAAARYAFVLVTRNPTVDGGLVADHSAALVAARRLSVKLVGVSTVFAGVAFSGWCGWWLSEPPDEKPYMLLGRLSYGEFLFATMTSLIAALFLIAGFVRADRRRWVVFRLAAVFLGGTLAIAVAEAICWNWPADAMPGNPWLTLTSDQTDRRTRRLVFDRNPHLVWKGLSIGCLAVENGHGDPYAEIVEFRTDHEGFRNHRGLKTADIIFIGDSHTEAGYLAEELTFARRVGRAMELTARNLGRINIGPSEELVILQEFGLRCRPRVVVWQICEHNDMTDELKYREWLDSGMPSVQPPESVRGAAWKSRSPNFRLYEFLRSLQEWPWQGEFTDGAGRRHPMLFVGPLTRFHRPRVSPGFPFLAQSLQAGVELAGRDEGGFQRVVLLIPEKLRVMGHFVDFSSETSRRLGRRWDVPRDQSLGFFLARLCEHWQVPFVDMTEPLKQLASKGDMVYLPYETHLSDSGHALVADHLVQVLNRLDDEPDSTVD